MKLELQDAVVLASALMLAACGQSSPDASDDPNAPGSVLRLDTLGATSMATHRAETVLVVGRDSDAPEYLFHRIRDGILTDDGVWIADGGSNEIRRYSSDGTFQYALGGSGDGPGEFRTLALIFLLEADSILAFDAGGRVTEFGPERQVVRTFDAPWSEDGLQATEYARIGAAELAALVRAPHDPREQLGQTRRGSVELILIEAGGSDYQRTGVRLPGRWWTASSTAEGVLVETPPDGPSALLATLGPDLVTSTSERLLLRVWSIDDFDPVSPPDGAVEVEQEQPASVAPRAIDQLVGSDDGDLWVGLHPAAGEDAVRRWIRIDSDSEVAARFDLPTSAWLLDARDDHLLVRVVDSLGNQSVQVVAIR